jgi:hypothetical protein
MENSQLRTSVINKHLGSSTLKNGKENLIKKRPSTTKLDLVSFFVIIGKNIPGKHLVNSNF